MFLKSILSQASHFQLFVSAVEGCKPPNQITDGSFSPSKEEYAYHEVVTYQCNDRKFTLTGQPSVSCTTFGNWSSDPPKCVGRHIIFVYKFLTFSQKGNSLSNNRTLSDLT